MAGLRRIVLDVLKPVEPSIMDIARKLSEMDSVDGVEIVVREVDRRVETVRVTVDGENLNFDKINTALEKFGASVHSVDKVAAGKRLITP